MFRLRLKRGSRLRRGGPLEREAQGVDAPQQLRTDPHPEAITSNSNYDPRLISEFLRDRKLFGGFTMDPHLVGGGRQLQSHLVGFQANDLIEHDPQVSIMKQKPDTTDKQA